MERHSQGQEQMPEQLLTYLITAEQGSIEGMASVIHAMGRKLRWSEKCIFQLNLALDEIISNTLAYGYDQPEIRRIEIFLAQQGNRLIMTIEDNGAPFNPLEGKPPEVDKPPLQRERCVGGMGIHLVKSMMDAVHYRHAQGKNVLVMQKNLEEPTLCIAPSDVGAEHGGAE